MTKPHVIACGRDDLESDDALTVWRVYTEPGWGNDPPANADAERFFATEELAEEYRFVAEGVHRDEFKIERVKVLATVPEVIEVVHVEQPIGWSEPRESPGVRVNRYRRFADDPEEPWHPKHLPHVVCADRTQRSPGGEVRIRGALVHAWASTETEARRLLAERIAQWTAEHPDVTP